MRSTSRRTTATAVVVALLATACLLEAPPDEAVAGTVQPPQATPDDRRLRADTIERHARQVTLRVRNQGCGGIATGSAVAVGSDLLVTNRHVVQGADQLEVNTWDGRSLTVGVAEVAMTHDIAVARVPEGLPEVAEVANADPERGDHVIVAGYPEGGTLVVREGRVLRRTEDMMFGAPAGAIAVAVDVAPGNSGGPVLNPDGRVVGIVYAASTDGDVGFAVPVSALREALEAGDGLASVPDCP